MLRKVFLNQAHALDAFLVAGESRSDGVEQSPVDFIDDFKMTWQQRLEPRERPPFEGLGQQRVVRVRQRSLCEIPCLFPFQTGLIQQNPQQLRDRDCRVRIVHLDGGLFGKDAPIGVTATKAPYEISQRAGYKKILLHETQSLPGAGRVVRIQHSSKGRGFKGLGDGADELTVAELLEVEIMGRISRPEAQCVDRLASVTDYWTIKGHANERGWLTHDRAQSAAAHFIGAIELDLDFLGRPWNLPGVLTLKPVVRLFLLPAVAEDLPEHAIFVSQAV